MRKVIEFFVRYPIWANAILVIIIIFGTLSYFSINKSFFPERIPDQISVQVSYPGASPEEMEEGITIKVEEALKGITGIEEVTSTSSENSARINIETRDDYEIDDVLAEVKNAVDGISSYPVGAEPPIVIKDRGNFSSSAAFLTLRGPADLKALKEKAEQIEDDMLNSGEISQISIFGYPPLEISVEVSEDDLQRYNLTFDQVANAIRFNNRDISGGTIKTAEEEIRIRANSRENAPAEIGRLVLRANPDGSNLLLRDIANIKLQFSDTPNKSYSNGQIAISVNVRKLPNEDLQEISAFVSQYIEDFNAKNENFELVASFDFNTILQQRIGLLTSNGLVGLILVLVCLGLFLSIRLSLWVALGIPISFLGMFIVGAMAGITVNMLSLFGMILVIGILVDDGIVIAENIHTHKERGKKPIQAAVDGTLEMLPAVFTSVVTTIIAFVPLMLLDNEGFTTEMSIVVIACLAFSLVEAFFVLPSHLATGKAEEGQKPKKDRLRGGLDRGIKYLRDHIYGSVLRFLIDWKWVSFAIPIFVFLVVLGMIQGGLIKTTIFPSIPFDDFEVALVLNPGTRESITEEYLQRFEDAIWEVNEEIKEDRGNDESLIETVSLNVGSSGGRGSAERGGHAGHLRIDLANMEEVEDISSFEIANRVRQKIGPVPEAQKFSVGGENRFGTPFSLALLSTNMEDLMAAKEEAKAEILNLSSLKDLQDNTATGQREIQLQMRPQSYFLGFSQQDITSQIRQAFFGEEAQRLIIGTDEVRVWVRYPEEDRLTISQMESMRIRDGLGNEYPLRELADYGIERGVMNINHFNGKREVRLEADLVDPYEPVPPIIEKVETDILPAILAKYPNVTYSFEGQSRRSERTVASFVKVFPVAFIMMILTITLSFRSLYQAILILLLIPLGLVCAAIGHGIHGQPISMLSMYGMIALSGVIVNDAVVMLDKYNQNLLEGMRVEEAAFNAGTSRFRAILLTSITTVAGLYPLILEKSFQAQFLIPMAISVAYGVMFGTLMILLFFPVIILVFNDMKLYVNKGFRRGKHFLNPNEPYRSPDSEEVEPAIREQRRLQKVY
uniref:Efflux RND transporter permease subunit n=1 Tax=Roseihalotalea indica TaxID=2867963 RepID=A0AA49GUU8_9BACT|nr:efflux RND transporter permease subunit [Tunicatimonas sp. TK19036]